MGKYIPKNKTGTKIYGVDPSQKLTPLIVRDAVIECFRQAHCMDADIGDKDQEANRLYCKEVVHKAFTDSGGDFKNPSKKDILAALEKLAEFAKKFRDQELIRKHYAQIMQLVNKLE